MTDSSKTVETMWQPIEQYRPSMGPVDVWVQNVSDGYRVTDAYFGRPHHTCGEAGQYCDSCPPSEDVWCDCFGALNSAPAYFMPLPSPPCAA